jgi:hypothetical protein
MIRALTLSLLLIVPCSSAWSSTLVVPNLQTAVAGNANETMAGTPANFEFQEDFGRGQFSSVTGDLLINQIAFRSAPGFGPLNATDNSVAIYLSTSPFAPNTNAPGNVLITSDYAANKGPDNTLVYSAGPGTLLSSPGCASPGPCASTWFSTSAHHSCTTRMLAFC